MCVPLTVIPFPFGTRGKNRQDSDLVVDSLTDSAQEFACTIQAGDILFQVATFIIY